MFKPVKPTAVTPVTGVTFFNATLEGFNDNYCVYEVWLADQLIYVGSCKFTMFGTLPDAQSNSMFMKMVARDAELNVRIIATGNRADCYNHRTKHARSLPDIPVCNKHGAFGRFVGVQCIEDGAIYPSQSAAAQAYGLSQGNISSHLKGAPGYANVGGRTFRKVALPAS